MDRINAPAKLYWPMIYATWSFSLDCLHNGPVTVIDTLTELDDGPK